VGILGGFWLGVKGTRQRGPDHQAVPPRAGARRRVAEPLRRFRQGRHQASPAPDSFHAANDLIFGVENGAAIYLGARLAIEGALTVGILFTYMSYKRQILEKVARLIEKMIELRARRGHGNARKRRLAGKRLASFRGAQAALVVHEDDYAPLSSLSMILSENRHSTFRDHALDTRRSRRKDNQPIASK